MFNQNDKVELRVINTYNKGLNFPYDEKSSSLVINLPTDIENIDFPENLLVLKVYEIQRGKYSFKQLIHRIFVGEVFSVEEMHKIDPLFMFSSGMDLNDLCNLKHNAPCVFYKNDRIYSRYSLLAKLKDMDIVVSNIDELKIVLTEMSKNFSQVQDGMSRIRNIKKNINKSF